MSPVPMKGKQLLRMQTLNWVEGQSCTWHPLVLGSGPSAPRKEPLDQRAAWLPCISSYTFVKNKLLAETQPYFQQLIIFLISLGPVCFLLSRDFSSKSALPHLDSFLMAC